MNPITKRFEFSMPSWLRWGGKSSKLSDSHLSFLDVVVGEIPEAVLIIDELGGVLRHNQRMEAVFANSKLVEGASLASLLDCLDVFSAEKIAEIAGKPFSEERFATRDINGGLREFRMRILPMPVSANRHWRMMMMVDITDLVNLQKQRDRTLAILTHDMRTPIASLLAVCRDEAQSQVELVGNVKKHASFLLSLIDDFILSIRAEDNIYPTEEVLLETLLDEAIYQVRELVEDRNMSLSCDFGAPLFVSVDARLMTRVVVNLISNAVRHGLEATQIQLTAKQDVSTAGRALVRISISNIVAAKTTAKATVDKGFGMGFDFVRSVVAKHNGYFSQNITSEAGATASVEIVLPVVS